MSISDTEQQFNTLEWYKIDEDLLRRWEPVVKGRRFVWLFSPPWEGVWTRQNHFAIRIARLGGEVLYVEQVPSLLQRFCRRGWQAFSALQPKVREVEPRLFVMTPLSLFPGVARSDWVAAINGRLWAKIIQQWLSRRGWEDYLCWCRLPQFSLPTLQALKPHTVVYDITDDYIAYTSTKVAKRKVQEREEKLLKLADLIFLTSNELKYKEVEGKSFLVPNGVDYDLFAIVASPDLDPHPVVAQMPKPVIGYVGLISTWMDFELLEMLSRKWPGHVIIVGPVDERVKQRVKAIPGLVWTGFVPRHELPRYIKGFDVCILPRLVNDLTRKQNPLKIWEYLATGKPIVSVDLPALEPLQDLVDIAKDRNHFIALVDKRLKGEDSKRSRKRQEKAKNLSWDIVFDKMVERLQFLFE